MGLSSTTNRKNYTGDGSSTIFSFPYEFFNPNDLQVYLYDINSSIVFPQTINTNYTISGAANLQGIYPTGGNVVMNSAFPSNLQIVIARAPIPTNTYVLGQNSPINSVAIGQQFDYLTALIQRLNDQVSRCIQLPDGLGLQNSSSFGVVLPQNIFAGSSANLSLVVNSGATGITLLAINSSLMPVGQGGTGVNSILPVGGVWYTLTGSSLGITTAGAAGQVLVSQGASGPVFQNVPAAQSGILQVGFGGTGTGTSYIQYGVVFASSATQMGNTPAGGQDQVLRGNVGAAPSFGTVNLSSGSSVVGTLSTTFGGTGTGTSFILYGVVFASSVTQMATTTAGGQDQPLVGNAGAAPSFQTLNLSSGSSVTGVLPVARGGTAMGTSFIQYGVLFASSATQIANTAAGSAGQVLTSNGAAPPSYQGVTVFNSVSTKTATYNLTTSDQMIEVSSSGFQINLYGASGNSGKEVTFIKTDTNNAVGNGVTIVGSGANISGSAFVLQYQYESARLFCDGLNWQIEALRKAPTVTYLSSGITAGTYTTPSGCVALRVRQVGGGGGGGGTASGVGNAGGGGGGGGGGFVQRTIFNPAGSYLYTVGAGGPGGVSGNNSGQTGSSTIFGSSVLIPAMVASGGNPGNGAAASAIGITAAGGTGGAANGGDLNISGGSGFYGLVVAATSSSGGYGGDTPFGTRNIGNLNSNSTGNSGTLYGGGGAGGDQINNGGNQAGGPGAVGIIVIEEYYV